jgi:PIN domain nuclease of toxin-antitoxin system
VLDTHCLVWMDQAVERMGAQLASWPTKPIAMSRLAVSAISFWEVALLVRKGRLRLEQSLGVWRRDLLGRGVIELPLGGATCIAAAQLGYFHADPADRFIVATARELGATLLTADDKILAWSGRLDRRDARV